MSNSSIRPIDRPISDATTPGQNGSGSNGNKGVLHISQSSRTGASSSDCLMSYPGHSVVGSYPTAEIQSVYSTAPATWVAESIKIPQSRSAFNPERVKLQIGKSNTDKIS